MNILFLSHKYFVKTPLAVFFILMKLLSVVFVTDLKNAELSLSTIRTQTSTRVITMCLYIQTVKLLSEAVFDASKYR